MTPTTMMINGSAWTHHSMIPRNVITMAMPMMPGMIDRKSVV